MDNGQFAAECGINYQLSIVHYQLYKGRFVLTLILSGHDYKYELESALKLFIPARRFEFVYNNEDIRLVSGDYFFTRKRIFKSGVLLYVICKIGDKTSRQTKILNIHDASDDECEFALSVLLFKCLSKLTGINPKWGIITGVRPVKRVNEMLDTGMDKEEIKEELSGRFLVSKEKIDIALKTALVQKSAQKTTNTDSFSLYISIPFCPSRCSYCSFVSQSVDKALKIMDEYIMNLIREIEYTAEITKRLGLRLDTIYIGGGTPTTLSEADLFILMKKVQDCFDMSSIREYTVEAGRADTITREKLEVIKSCGADRISINPQTLNDDVLKAIDRRHTVEQFYQSYDIAKKIGFKAINTDLIAGLPTDTVESFKNTIDGIIRLYPENVTVHTLSVKRASNININSEYGVLNNPTDKMIEYATSRLLENGYNPYYLYRQKNMVGNLENIGWERDNSPSLYNIFIMEEIQTIIALGAGASTKIVSNDGHLNRIFNYKFPLEYNKHFDLMLRKKDEIEGFYINA